MRLSVGVLFCLSVTLATAGALAQKCNQIGPDDDLRVRNFIAERLKISPDQLKVEHRAPEKNCFVQVDISGATTLTLFMDPSRQFIAPEIYDLNADPLAEQKHDAADVRKMLENGVLPTKGAGLHVVVFTDLECPYCARFHHMLASLSDQPIEITYRSFPLPMHPWAMKSAVASTCIARQSAALYWSFVDHTFEEAKNIAPEDFEAYIQEWSKENPGIDNMAFETCIKDPTVIAQVSADVALGHSLHVSATPTFFIEGMRGEGAVDAEEFKKMLKESQVLLQPISSQSLLAASKLHENPAQTPKEK